MAFDLIDLGHKEKYFLICIDHFTRYQTAEISNNRLTRIAESIKGWCVGGKLPYEIITNNGTEFKGEFNSLFREL